MSVLGERIIETYNLFLNSDDGVGNGQNYDFQFGNNGIQTRDKAQFIRLSLVNFNMYKNWTDVNPNNSGMVLLTKSIPPSAGIQLAAPINLDSQNYTTLRDLAKNWADNFAAVGAGTALGIPSAPWTVTSWTPDAGTGITGTTNNIMSFLITTTIAHGITPLMISQGDFSLQSVIDPENWAGLVGVERGGDSALLLGGCRVPQTNLSSAQGVGSYIITVPTVNTIRVSGYFPGQRSTEPNVYVRINPSPQIFGSEAFDAPLTTTHESNLNPANIFAEIRVDTEMVQWEPTSDKQYFVNMYQKALNYLNIRLTDSRNRALPLPVYPIGGSGLPVTAGDSRQNTVGNRHFTMTVRVEVVEGVAHGEPEVPNAHIQHSVPARFDSNMLIWQKNGKNMYNKGPGYS